MDNLCIAMAKGRLAKAAVKLFRQAGYDLPENMLKSRKLIFEIESENFLALFYVRRFLIHPIFVLILMPAFYYYRRKNVHKLKS